MERNSAERLAALVSTLKPLPQVATLVIEKCVNPRSTTREIADCLENDPAFTAKVLSVANSVFYRGDREIKTARDAVLRIGQRTLQHIVYATAVHNIFEKGKRSSSFDHDAFWLHSLSVAIAARLLAEKMTLPPNEPFTAGILHDIGKLIIEQAAGERASEGAPSKLESVMIGDEEALLEGLDPAEVGYCAAKKWGLPLSIAEAIGFIRVENLDFLENKNVETLIRIVQSANSFCEDMANLNGNAHKEFLEAYAEAFGFSLAEVVAFSDSLRQEVAQTAGLFNIDEGDVHRYFDALAVAQYELEKARLEPAP
jgi:HD-like signal output (HDOD) protein